MVQAIVADDADANRSYAELEEWAEPVLDAPTLDAVWRETGP